MNSRYHPGYCLSCPKKTADNLLVWTITGPSGGVTALRKQHFGNRSDKGSFSQFPNPEKEPSLCKLK
ncbi:hypothetical protein B1222_05840 [Paenibacillus larvae subsp. pulvifaciens]|nr:hypothetical protein B1222_05840 [Paenibacillus larvae subsp. pulvifaciens]AQZ45479.1 hypothetical protein B5S25_01595 [Paenibacillus larvae subsp. pulvifaciens]MBH0344962.1 hypothetical protein [Paenibacillus larvae]